MATITTSPASVHPTAIATVWLSLCGFGVVWEGFVGVDAVVGTQLSTMMYKTGQNRDNKRFIYLALKCLDQGIIFQIDFMGKGVSLNFIRLLQVVITSSVKRKRLKAIE